MIRPEHYKINNIEVFDIINKANILSEFCFSNVLKYIYRYKFKNGLEDLTKAKTYINILIRENKKIYIDNIKDFININYNAIDNIFYDDINIKNLFYDFINNFANSNFKQAELILDVIIKLC